MAKSEHHNVYVIELDRGVLEDRKFRAENPDYVPGKPCVYVGLTGLSPEERFAQHQAGVKSSRWVRKYGIRLKPRLYEKYNPMSYKTVVKREQWLAQHLRKKGYGVWQK